MDSQNRSFKESVQLISLFILLLCLLALTFIARQVILFSLIGVGFSALISPLLSTMRRRFRVPRQLSAVVFLLFAILLAGLFIFGVGFVIADQAQDFVEKAPEIMARLRSRSAELIEKYPWIQKQVEGFDFIGAIRSGMERIAYGVQTGFVLGGGLAFAFIIGLYLAVSSKEYGQSFLSLFPSSRRSQASEMMRASGKILRKWFRAQLIDMVVVGILTALGLWLVGVKYWAIFGLLSGVLCVVPYLGILLVVIVTLLIVGASQPSQIPWVIAVFFITQQIEGNVILPLVMRDQVQLPEVPLLIFMLLMGNWLGLLGVFMAPPLFAVCRTLFLMTVLPRLERL